MVLRKPLLYIYKRNSKPIIQIISQLLKNVFIIDIQYNDVNSTFIHLREMLMDTVKCR